ncbi:hypothetical protein G7081_03370 [Vagococcus coleopterorum]|uniref:Uncharacterized protein n=1 Tax=Vagococcus coleopterorum TaxID=2714946 RepID=A0A6G8AMJ3_9ENTE|nr:hypothetical protein [Vagococcus coleopterorum]QIL46179.1 hypothetical protein G7081_03370 [Vagococcus coleopterorum]
MPTWMITKVVGMLFKKKEKKGEQSPMNKWLMKRALMSALPLSVRKQIGNVENIKEIVFPSEESQLEKLQKGLFPTAKQKNQAKLQKQLGQLTGGMIGSKETKVATGSNPADLTKMITKTVLDLAK